MLARRDPLTKLAVALAFVAAATLSQNAVLSAAMVLAILAWLGLAEGVSAGRLIRAMLPFLFFAATTSWIYIAVPNPAALAPGSGWAAALLVALRTLAIGAASIAFAFTTEPADLARALVARTRLSRRFVHGSLAAIQFLPALAEEARMARLIARAGAPMAGGRIARLRARLIGLTPALALILLAGAIRRAGSTAVSMELRGIGTASTRPTWRVPRFQTADALFAGTALLFLAALVFAAPSPLSPRYAASGSACGSPGP